MMFGMFLLMVDWSDSQMLTGSRGKTALAVGRWDGWFGGSVVRSVETFGLIVVGWDGWLGWSIVFVFVMWPVDRSLGLVWLSI